MKIKAFTYIAGISILATAGMTSCVGDSNSPGLEYMPDMYRSAAVEGYFDYGEVDGKFSEDAYNLVASKYNFTPPANTIPYQGEANNGILMPYKHGAPVNADKTHGLYGIPQDSAGYSNSALDVNPIPYSPEVEKKGKVLYDRFCQHCHGEKGAGDGGVPATGKFPPPPAYDGALKDLPAGQIFYSITYGKGAMGSHASQLNKEERWTVVYYVQKLQGKELGVVEDTSAVGLNVEVENLDAEVNVPLNEGGSEETH